MPEERDRQTLDVRGPSREGGSGAQGRNVNGSDPGDPGDSGEPAPATVDELEEIVAPEVALKKRDEEVAELKSKVLYLHADFENFKKRTEKRYREALEFSNEPILKDFLAVLDNLERAVGHAQDTRSCDVAALLAGLENVIQQFGGVLRRHGVEPVSAEGEKFDPMRHEAVAQIPGDEDGLVGNVLEKGFTLRGRLLRPARVTVTKVASPQAGG